MAEGAGVGEICAVAQVLDDGGYIHFGWGGDGAGAKNGVVGTGRVAFSGGETSGSERGGFGAMVSSYLTEDESLLLLWTGRLLGCTTALLECNAPLCPCKVPLRLCKTRLLERKA